MRPLNSSFDFYDLIFQDSIYLSFLRSSFLISAWGPSGSIFLVRWVYLPKTGVKRLIILSLSSFDSNSNIRKPIEVFMRIWGFFLDF